MVDFSIESDGNFFIAKNELVAQKSNQAELASTQNSIWAIIAEQFDAFEWSFSIARDCNQMLFSNQQPVFISHALSSLLAMIHKIIDRFHSATFAHHMKFLNAIPVLS